MPLRFRNRLGWAIALAASWSAALGAGPRDFSMLGKYCSKCHNTEDWAGGIAFETLSPEDIPQDAQTWEKAMRKLRGGLMPPAGNPQPDRKAVEGFVDWVEGTIDHAALPHVEPGRVALHRLNRKEYANAVRDLLDVELDARELLPRDDSHDGFDNIASALQVSPSFLEQYLAAARKVAKQALGDAQSRPVGTTYTAGGSGNQFFRAAGLPLGTRGGIVVEHEFPADGEYVINIANMAQAIWVYNLEFENQVVVTLDRRRIYETSVGGEADMKAIDQRQDPAVDAINQRLKNIHFTAAAGPHQIGITFRQRSYAESENWLGSNVPGGGQEHVLRVSSFEVRGPLSVTGVSETPSRRRIFSCHPATASEEPACAREIVQRLAEQAFRHPIGAADVADLMRFYEGGRQEGGFESGIRQAITAILADPEFLYRSERAPEQVAAGQVFRVSAVDLASRLSFFLWSSLPDEELLRAAEQGQLHQPETLRREVRRMLRDPRAEALASNFAFQWLNMAKLAEIQPDPAIFPNLNGDMRSDFREELRLFIDATFRDDHSVLDLLRGDYTYLNERLALHYGVPGIKGSQFRRVQLTDPNRLGLLGKGAVLMVTSYPNRTAPVLRGQFILERLMGTPPAEPPPNVGNLKENPEGKRPQTMREQMLAHRRSPSCNGCHGLMDPLGFALESFDAVGEYRTKDRFAGAPIDASGQLPDGTALNGPDDLRSALLRRPDQFVQTLTEKLMTYALGRSLVYTDMPAVRAIVHSSAAEDYRFESVVMGIVTSAAFQTERAPAPPLLKQASLAAVGSTAP